MDKIKATLLNGNDSDDDAFYNVEGYSLSQDQAASSSVESSVENTKRESFLMPQGNSYIAPSKVFIQEDDQGPMQEGDDDKVEVTRPNAGAAEIADCNDVALAITKPDKKIPLDSDTFFKEWFEKHKDYSPLDEVINDRNFLLKEVISVETAHAYHCPPTFNVAFAEDNQYLIVTFALDSNQLHMKIYDMCKNNKEIKDVVLSKQQVNSEYARTQDMWYQHRQSIYYYIIDGQTIRQEEFNMLSQETNIISQKELAPKDLTVLNEETTFKMDQVGAIIFAKNIESDKPQGDSDDESLDIQQQFVGLMCKDDRVYMSIRKMCDLDVPLFTIALSKDECSCPHWYTFSISQCINADGQEVVVIKSSGNKGTDSSFIKVFILKENTWSQIFVDQKKKIDDQVTLFEAQAKISLKHQISNNQIVDRHNSFSLFTIDKRKSNSTCEQPQSIQTLTDKLSVAQQKHIFSQKPNKERFDALSIAMSDKVIDRAIIVENQHTQQIKLIHKVEKSKDIIISTYKTNSQFEEITNSEEEVNSNKFESVQKLIGDENYPFKEGDGIEIIKNKKKDEFGNENNADTKVQFKSPKDKVPVELIFSNQKPKYNYSCYSSIMQENGKRRSISFATIVEDIRSQKYNLHEYKLNWEVDKNDKFLNWLQPQLQKDVKIIGPINMNNGSSMSSRISGIKPFITSTDKIEGLLIKDSNGDQFILNFDKFEYEFQDSTFRSSIKTITTTQGKDLTVSINIFDEDMLEKFSRENISIQDQILLSQDCHNLNLNIVPITILREWLFTDIPSILASRQFLNGMCRAFTLLNDPQNLKKLLLAKEPEKPQPSLMKKLIKNGVIEEENGEVPDCFSDESLQVVQHNDMLFHSFLETLISMCYKGTTEEQIQRAPSMDIIFGHLAKHPSASNDKIIQSEITFMMLTMANPTQAIRPFFLSYSQEECETNSEVFKVLPGQDLPTLYNKSNYLMSYQRVGQVPLEEGMGHECTNLYNKEKSANEAQHIKVTIRYQSFSQFHARQMISNDTTNKPMNNSQLVKIATNYCDNFQMDLESSAKIRSIIEYQFDNETQSYFYNQIAWYITTVVTPIYALLFTKCQGTAAKILLSIASIGFTGMFSLEMIAIRMEGPKKYFSQGWNWLDIIIFPIFGVFFFLRIQTFDVDDPESDHMQLLILLNTFIQVCIAIKVLYFMKVNEVLGLMSALLLGVFNAVVPFLIIFFYFVFIFTVMAFNLGSNKSNAASFTNITPAIGYFFQSFQNAIGNISNPSIDYAKKDTSLLRSINIYLIYIFWFLAQIILLIVLLNFVIALISQHYEDVMNSQVMHIILMKQELNKEYDLYNRFLVDVGFRELMKVDAFIMIEGKEVGGEDEWKGLSQTMKQINGKQFEEQNSINAKQFAAIREEIATSTANTNAQFANQAIANTNTNAQLAEIKSMIQALSKSE